MKARNSTLNIIYGDLLSRIIMLILITTVVPIKAQQKKELHVKTSQEIEYQVIDGFGGSDAWRAQFVGKYWPNEKKERIADLLFSMEEDDNGNPKGIGMSIWRFYLSAGTTEQGDSSQISNEWRRGECFQNSDGTYDWTKMEGQRWFLQAAKDRGVNKFLIFTNSPPVHMTNNGFGFATNGDKHLNLKAGMYDDYSKFMVDVLEYFEKEDFHFNYISPVNEPQWNWDGNSQEGTPASNEEIYTLVKQLSYDLEERGLSTKIIIGEAGTIGHAAIDMSTLGKESDGRDNQVRFFFSKDSPFFIGNLPNIDHTITAHSYFSVWPLDRQVEDRKLVNKTIKSIDPTLKYWQSEYCILQKNDEIKGGNKRDLGMGTAMYVARIIHNDMILTNASSWQWWTSISQKDFKDGLVYLNEVESANGESKDVKFDGEFHDSKLLWVLGNYSRFVRPGMVRIQCELSEEQSIENGLLVSAYKDFQEEKVVYVFTNLSEELRKVKIGEGKRAKTYITDANKDLELIVQKLSGINIPARSVVTVVK